MGLTLNQSTWVGTWSKHMKAPSFRQLEPYQKVYKGPLLETPNSAGNSSTTTLGRFSWAAKTECGRAYLT